MLVNVTSKNEKVYASSAYTAARREVIRADKSVRSHTIHLTKSTDKTRSIFRGSHASNSRDLFPVVTDLPHPSFSSYM